jgi:hypothetical protein
MYQFLHNPCKLEQVTFQELATILAPVRHQRGASNPAHPLHFFSTFSGSARRWFRRRKSNKNP